MSVTLNFDMDGTIAALYDTPHWLDCLRASDPTPYMVAKPCFQLSPLARLLNRLQRNGYRLSVISWTSKTGTPDFNRKVDKAKRDWLNRHLPSVHWDEIHIVPYGTPKETFAHESDDVLFDDEEPNRKAWTGKAYDASDILKILKEF